MYNTIQKHLDCFMDTRRNTQEASKLFSVDGKFMESIYTLQDHYITLLSEFVGDSNGWIDWYIYDNNLGKRGLIVRLDGKPPIAVRDISGLVDVIVADRGIA